MDSGKEVRGNLKDALGADLSVPTAYGRVESVDKEKVVLSHDRDADDETSSWGIIWVPSILKVKVYR